MLFTNSDIYSRPEKIRSALKFFGSRLPDFFWLRSASRKLVLTKETLALTLKARRGNKQRQPKWNKRNGTHTMLFTNSDIYSGPGKIRRELKFFGSRLPNFLSIRSASRKLVLTKEIRSRETLVLTLQARCGNKWRRLTWQ
jgi:hypothetical protein